MCVCVSHIRRYLSGSYRIAWELESSEAQRRGRAVWSVHNRMVQGMIMQVKGAHMGHTHTTRHTDTHTDKHYHVSCR